MKNRYVILSLILYVFYAMIKFNISDVKLFKLCKFF